jgi:hypothetical protein
MFAYVRLIIVVLAASSWKRALVPLRGAVLLPYRQSHLEQCSGEELSRSVLNRGGPHTSAGAAAKGQISAPNTGSDI